MECGRENRDGMGKKGERTKKGQLEQEQEGWTSGIHNRKRWTRSGGNVRYDKAIDKHDWTGRKGKREEGED